MSESSSYSDLKVPYGSSSETGSVGPLSLLPEKKSKGFLKGLATETSGRQASKRHRESMVSLAVPRGTTCKRSRAHWDWD